MGLNWKDIKKKVNVYIEQQERLLPDIRALASNFRKKLIVEQEES